MKKITALLLVVFMMLAMVLTACGESEGPTDSESASASGNTNTDASESAAVPGQTEGTQSEPAQSENTQSGDKETTGEQTTGGEQPGTGPVTPGSEKQPEDEPEPIDGSDYTKISAPPAALNIIVDLLTDVAGIFNEEIDM